MENREFYEAEAFAKTLKLVSFKIKKEDPVKLMQHPSLKMLISDFDAQIQSDDEFLTSIRPMVEIFMHIRSNLAIKTWDDEIPPNFR